MPVQIFSHDALCRLGRSCSQLRHAFSLFSCRFNKKSTERTLIESGKLAPINGFSTHGAKPSKKYFFYFTFMKFVYITVVYDIMRIIIIIDSFLALFHGPWRNYTCQV
jgi:hypothetical protein